MAELLRPPPRSSWRDRARRARPPASPSPASSPRPAPCCWWRSRRGGCCARRRRRSSGRCRRPGRPVPVSASGRPRRHGSPAPPAASATRHRAPARRPPTAPPLGRSSCRRPVPWPCPASTGWPPGPVWSTSSPPPAGPPPRPTSRPWRWRPRSPTGRGSTCRGWARSCRRCRPDSAPTGGGTGGARPTDAGQPARSQPGHASSSSRRCPAWGRPPPRPSSTTAPSTVRSSPSTTCSTCAASVPAKLDAFRDLVRVG